MSVIEAPAEATTTATADPAPYRWRWAALTVVLTGGAVELLDSSVTNIAGPTMRAELGGGPGLIQWLSAAYTLAMVGGLLIGARIGDIVGRKPMFLVGIAGFVLVSVTVAASQTPGQAIAARVVQGLVGAAMVPQVFGLLREMFPPHEVRRAFGLAGPIMGAAAIGGPSLAGWLIGMDLLGLGWRTVFLINLPIGAAILIAAIVLVPRGAATRKFNMDVTGAVLAVVASTLLVYPLVQGREAGWPLWSFGMIAASVIAFGVFGVHQKRRFEAGREVLVIPSLFRKRAFNGGLALGILLTAAMAGIGLVTTLHTQLGLRYSPLHSAVVLIPFAAAMGGTMAFGDRLARYGRKTLLAGALLTAAGVAMLVPTLTWAGADLEWYQLIPGLALAGVGAAMFMGRYFDSVMSGVETHEIGSASGSLTAVQQLGSSFGVALLGTIFFGRFTGDPATIQSASRVTLLVTVAVLLAAFVVGFALPRKAAH